MSTFPDKNLIRFAHEYEAEGIRLMDRASLEGSVQNRFGYLRNISELSDDKLREMLGVAPKNDPKPPESPTISTI